MFSTASVPIDRRELDHYSMYRKTDTRHRLDEREFRTPLFGNLKEEKSLENWRDKEGKKPTSAIMINPVLGLSIKSCTRSELPPFKPVAPYFFYTQARKSPVTEIFAVERQKT